MLTVFLAAVVTQSPVDAQAGRKSAEIALAFLRARDAATADRLGSELRPWLAAQPGTRIDAAAIPTLRAAGQELRAMFVGHPELWGHLPSFAAAAAAADTASRALEAELGPAG